MDVPEGKRRHNTGFCPKCIDPLTIRVFIARKNCETSAFGNLILYLQHSIYPIANVIFNVIFTYFIGHDKQIILSSQRL